MALQSFKENRRRQDRLPAVLPVRVRGKDSSGAPFEELAHTLDFAPNGTRLGAIHHQLKALDRLTIFYRQRRMEFTVIWTKLLEGTKEYQVGLQLFSQENEHYGTNFFISVQPLTKAHSHAEL
jgi:hypothetical protein